MARLKFLEPKEWRKIEYSKRVHMLVLMYFCKCTNERLFEHGKMNKGYFMIRRFMEKQPVYDLNSIYDYLWSIEGKSIKSLTELFTEKAKFQSQQGFVHIPVPNETKHEDITLEDIMNL